MVVPKSISDDESLLSPSDVAKEMGVHRSTVHNWIRDGMIATERHGAFHAVKRKELDRFRQLYKIEPEPPPKRKKKRSRK